MLGTGELDTEGVFRGSLYLRGGGDPTFGSRSFTRKSYGGGATVQDLAALLEDTGIERITGRVYGDESAFDSLRGGPDSGYGVSPWVGPLSALSYNRGLFTEGGRGYQASPPAFAAARLDDGPRGPRRDGAAEAPRRAHASGRARARERRVAADGTADPAHQQAVGQLLRRDAAEGPRAPGRRGRHHGRGRADRGRPRTLRWARAPRSWTAPGSSRGNRASPQSIVRLLTAIVRSDDFDPFVDSLPIAGQDGTLFDRMRRGARAGAAAGKTGTLSNVSALSGYCEARSGDNYAYSILMNGVYPTGARRLQDRMLQAIAALRLGGVRELVHLGEPVGHLGQLEHLVRGGLRVLAVVPESELQPAPVAEPCELELA